MVKPGKIKLIRSMKQNVSGFCSLVIPCQLFKLTLNKNMLKQYFSTVVKLKVNMTHKLSNTKRKR